MKYTMYLDESGDHNLCQVDPNYPILCLCGIIFDHEYYVNRGNEMVNDLKRKYFGKIDVILHSCDIRKQEGCFSILANPNSKSNFYRDLNDLISNLDFKIIAVAINKNDHVSRYGYRAENPYSLGLDFLMERFTFMMGNNDKGAIIAESRGIAEDQQLREEFDTLQAFGTNYVSDFRCIEYLRTEKKEENNNGLQLADLAAYPIATKVLRPDKRNLAYDVLEPKFKKSWFGKIKGYGLKIFP